MTTMFYNRNYSYERTLAGYRLTVHDWPDGSQHATFQTYYRQFQVQTADTLYDVFGPTTSTYELTAGDHAAALVTLKQWGYSETLVLGAPSAGW